MKSQNKGITLVALIITIIILLILATVTIMSLTGDGIIGKARQAKTEYENAQDTENSLLQGYLSQMEELIGNNSTAENGTEPGGEDEDKDSNLERIIDVNTLVDNGNGTFTSNNGVTISIGDYVNYNEGSFEHTPDTTKGAGTSKTGGSSSSGYTLGTNTITTEDLSWRVLGINAQGQLELISADPTSQTLYLANDEGYVNAEDNLNNYCNDLYGKGEYATGARSLNVEDINKLTKYDPTTYSGYEQKWIYKFISGQLYYSNDGGVTWKIQSYNNSSIKFPGDTTEISVTKPGSKEITSTYYQYNISDNLTTEDGYTSEKAKEIVDMLTSGMKSSDTKQWLASVAKYCAPAQPLFDVRCVDINGVGARSVYTGQVIYYSHNCYVRPVITISSDVLLTGIGKNIGSENNMWNISKN